MKSNRAEFSIDRLKVEIRIEAGQWQPLGQSAIADGNVWGAPLPRAQLLIDEISDLLTDTVAHQE